MSGCVGAALTSCSPSNPLARGAVRRQAPRVRRNRSLLVADDADAAVLVFTDLARADESDARPGRRFSRVVGKTAMRPSRRHVTARGRRDTFAPPRRLRTAGLHPHRAPDAAKTARLGSAARLVHRSSGPQVRRQAPAAPSSTPLARRARDRSQGIHALVAKAPPKPPARRANEG